MKKQKGISEITLNICVNKKTFLWTVKKQQQLINEKDWAIWTR